MGCPQLCSHTTPGRCLFAILINKKNFFSYAFFQNCDKIFFLFIANSHRRQKLTLTILEQIKLAYYSLTSPHPRWFESFAKTSKKKLPVNRCFWPKNAIIVCS